MRFANIDLFVQIQRLNEKMNTESALLSKPKIISGETVGHLYCQSVIYIFIHKHSRHGTALKH